MAFDNGEGYWHCPHCGNNGDQDEVHAEGTEWFSGNHHFTVEVLEVDDEDHMDDWFPIDTDSLEIDQTNEREIDDFTCKNCEESFRYFEHLDYEEWEDQWGGDDAVRDRKVSAAAVQAGRAVSDTIKMHLKTGHNEAARAIANDIRKMKDMDTALRIDPDNGFVNYEIRPHNQSECTTETRRLFEVGRELLAYGYRSMDMGQRLVDGTYEIRGWAIQAEMDDELELDAIGDNHPWPLFKLLRLTVLQSTPLGIKTAKTIYLMVPPIEERPQGKDDPDQQVVIFEMPEGLIEKVIELGLNATPSTWPAEVIDRLTFYRCEREKLAQTLEVVFDMTPEGYLPLLKETEVAA